jgi:hypothetical protein
MRNLIQQNTSIKMKYLSFAVFFILVSCGNNKEVLLPKSDVTIVKTIDNHSPIYIFFKSDGKDTIAEVNRKNEIISTNWIFNIDKRLPLRLVIPEIMKLQEKKRSEKMHKNEAAQNYYSYADSIGKNMAFIPFTQIHYKMNKPSHEILVYFTKDNLILVNGVQVEKTDLEHYIKALPSDKPNKFMFCFAKDLSFGNYIQDKIVLQSVKLPIPIENVSNSEFIY